MRLFEVTAKVDDGCNYFKERHFIFAESSSEAHLTVKHTINNRDCETTCTILDVKEINMTDVRGKTMAVIRTMI